MTEKQVNELIKELSGQPVEIKEINDSLYIKFDFLPYDIRSFVHAQSSYDHSKMENAPRDCGCGHAYFLESNHFYNLMRRYEG